MTDVVVTVVSVVTDVTDVSDVVVVAVGVVEVTVMVVAVVEVVVDVADVGMEFHGTSSPPPQAQQATAAVIPNREKSGLIPSVAQMLPIVASTAA